MDIIDQQSSFPLSAEEFKRIYSQVPRLCVDLVIKTQGGIIFTLRSLPQWQDIWHLPGGTVRYKETILEATNRIAQRELGISVEVLKSLGYVEYPSEEKERGFGWAVSLVLLCQTKAEEIKVNDEASEAKIFQTLPEEMIAEQKTFLNVHWTEISA